MRLSFHLTVLLTLAMPVMLFGQLDPLTHRSAPSSSPLTQPTLSPGVLRLMQLDADFSRSTLAGGGKAFSGWFADNGLALNNGKQPLLGKARIAADATWDPAQYQLQWQPTGGDMGPSGDMGYTWGHYDGHTKDRNGNDVVTGGRYITVWKRMPDGAWKVALDASADEPPAAGDCCALKKP